MWIRYLWRMKYSAMLLLMLFGLSQGLSAQSPVRLQIEGGAFLQTIDEREAQLVSGYQLAPMFQGAVRVGKMVTDYFGARVGLHLQQKGARVPAVDTDTLSGSNATGFIILRGTYINVSAGAFARGDVSDGLALGAALELVGGFNVAGAFVNTLYDVGDPLRKTVVSDFFERPFIGVDLSGHVAFKMGETSALVVGPALEIQLNRAFTSVIFVPRFVGFGLRAAVEFGL